MSKLKWRSCVWNLHVLDRTAPWVTGRWWPTGRLPPGSGRSAGPAGPGRAALSGRGCQSPEWADPARTLGSWSPGRWRSWSESLLGCCLRVWRWGGGGSNGITWCRCVEVRLFAGIGWAGGKRKDDAGYLFGFRKLDDFQLYHQFCVVETKHRNKSRKDIWCPVSDLVTAERMQRNWDGGVTTITFPQADLQVDVVVSECSGYSIVQAKLRSQQTESREEQRVLDMQYVPMSRISDVRVAADSSCLFELAQRLLLYLPQISLLDKNQQLVS